LNEKDRIAMIGEAEAIAVIIVDKTRVLSYEFEMTEFPLWHNFLIKLGARKKGYCYHWAEELLKALPSQEYRFFERHWGVHNYTQVTENNAVILTRRGDRLLNGIVYDPWRGKGKAFWRRVSEDDQTWSELLTEIQILTGQM